MDYITKDILFDGRATGNLTFTMTAEWAEQRAGPSYFPIETELASFAVEGQITFGDYPEKLLKILLGTTSTTHDISSGLITDIEVIGNDFYDAAGKGILSLALNADDTKYRSGLYKLKLVDKANKKAKIYALSSISLKISEYSSFKDSLVKEVTLADGLVLDLGNGVNATCSANVDLSDFENGDAVVFSVLEKGDTAYTANIGEPSLRIPTVKFVCLGRQLADGRWYQLFCENAKFGGSSFMFTNEFAANEVPVKLIVDPKVGRVGWARGVSVTPSV